jgi:hypothetical protein
MSLHSAWISSSLLHRIWLTYNPLPAFVSPKAAVNQQLSGRLICEFRCRVGRCPEQARGGTIVEQTQ